MSSTTASSKPKLKRILSLTVRFMRGTVLVVAMFYFLLGMPNVWSWLHSKSAPQEMSFEDYLKYGSDNDWLILHDVYVDAENELRGAFPLRAGPDDKRPVKVFVSGNVRAFGERPQATLYGDYPGARGYALPIGRDQRQTVRGLRFRTVDFLSDEEEALHACKLPTEKELLMIGQGRKPIPTAGVIGGALLLASLLAVCVLLTWILDNSK
jgi:hypothetical protein